MKKTGGKISGLEQNLGKQTGSGQAKGDNCLSMEDLKKIARAFCEARDWDKAHNPKDLAVGAVTEASELLEIFRFCSEAESLKMAQEKGHRERIGEELADTLLFILRFAQLYQFDLTACLRDKLIKNQKKYPALKK